MKTPEQFLFLIAALAVLTPPGRASAESIYKWTDAQGQVHYSQQHPGDATPAQTIDIPPSSASSDSTDSTAEVARINALSEQMARERQATEQVRQEETIRNLEQANQQLQNDLLKQQQQQQSQNDTNGGVIIGQSPYSYPSYRPHPNDFSDRPPCQPWPDCHHHRPTPPPEPSKPLAKPNPPFHPAPAGVSKETPGGFRGR